jgi:hypothetical protein
MAVGTIVVVLILALVLGFIVIRMPRHSIGYATYSRVGGRRWYANPVYRYSPAINIGHRRSYSRGFDHHGSHSGSHHR